MKGGETGFTLAELMVALMIFGMLSAAGVALLSFGVRAQEASRQHLGDLAEIRRMGAAMAADFAQAAPRISRDANGSPRRAFDGAPGEVALVRGGWENVDGANRPSLQRVEYRLGSAGLERRAWRNVDDGEAMSPVVLVPGARALAIRYRGRDGMWRERWDPSRPDLMPAAVEVSLDTPSAGRVLQLFLVGTGS